MATKIVSFEPSQNDLRHEDFPLCKIKVHEYDKLGHKILEILWLSPDYAIYLTNRGIYIHFSDDKAKEKKQRILFTKICPELCELRFLTSDMDRRWRLSNLLKRPSRDESVDHLERSLFNHNIAQSLMLLMEGNVTDAKAIATEALDMAITRTTNDNTIRYLVWSLAWSVLLSTLVGTLYIFRQHVPIDAFPEQSPSFILSSSCGILGGLFSIITRVQTFEMKPCQQSNMNKWMALIRILIGLIGGFSVLLLANNALGGGLTHTRMVDGWQGTALIGFLGGFAERMVQTVFQRTSSSLERKKGTPVQGARAKSSKTAG